METTLRDLELIEALVAHGTMTAAADHLFVSQPALSQRLANLERKLNSQLFIRNTQGLEPTNDGLKLLDSARTALEAVREAEYQIRSQSAGERRIRIMSQCANNYSWLPDALASIRTQFPSLVVEVAAVQSDQIVEQVNAGKLDIAIITKLQQDMDQLKLEAVFDNELVAVTAESHPWADKHFVDVNDFSNEHLAVSGRSDETCQLALPIPVGAVPGKLTTLPVTNEMLVQMVSFGDAITVLPLWMAKPFVETAGVVARPIGPKPGFVRTWYAATRHGSSDELIRQLIDSIRAAAPRAEVK